MINCIKYLISPLRELKKIIYLVGAIKPRGLRPWGLIAPTRYIIFYSSLRGDINYILLHVWQYINILYTPRSI